MTAPADRDLSIPSRRTLLSGAAIAIVAGLPGRALAGKSAGPEDVTILNTAIAAEHEAVAAYQLGAESGLLVPDVKALALTFQGHHNEHIEALTAAVRSLGGQPADAKKAYEFPVSTLKTQKDVLELAASLERGAVSAYAGAIPLFSERELASAAASILADEAMHWAVLRSALGLEPVPGAFFK